MITVDEEVGSPFSRVPFQITRIVLITVITEIGNTDSVIVELVGEVCPSCEVDMFEAVEGWRVGYGTVIVEVKVENNVVVSVSEVSPINDAEELETRISPLLLATTVVR